jgi:type I restriction-modification system DNA methylase subunit
MTTKDEARATIAALVGRFQALTPAQVRDTYQEANTRKDFVLPLFRALGWNTDDANDVFEHRRVGRRFPDYAFLIRGVSRFYLEAKPLRENLDDLEWVKQAVSYAYNKGIPYVVLTNFKDLWVYNGDVKPQRFLVLSADKYLDDFEDLWLLSKDATEVGLLEQEARKHGALPPKVTVEKRLYEQLSAWRGTLFRELHLYRPDLTLPTVDETVQRMFNRLIFIRTCEDRRIEEPVLRPLVRQFHAHELKGSLWDALKRVFVDFDKWYDSELFMSHVLDMQMGAHFQDDTLAEVIAGLYGPPGGLVQYDFSVIDADVLGRVYEQYLGHVAQIVRQRHQEIQARLGQGMPPERALAETVEIIERPQRRKAQGIYYTPKWVVDYIVRETVGRFIDERQKRPDAIHGMRVLDPACGSGSFLIRAYDELLRWQAQGRPAEHVFSDERLAVLRNNIYGVDLDSQAVEITRLNLLLRALRERQRLPELGENMKRGNSLISGGEAELKPFFENLWQVKHPFNWEREFQQIIKAGGFDVVIGNPPYVRIQSLPRDEADYYRAGYESAFGAFDIYVMFIEKGLKLLKPGGRLGFITSGKFLKAEYGKKLQRLLKQEATVEEVVDLSAQQVFADATTYPVILVLRKGASEAKLRYTLVPAEFSVDGAGSLDQLKPVEVQQQALEAGVWPPPVGRAKTLMTKLEAGSVTLGQLASNVFQGLITSADRIYTLEHRSNAAHGLVRVFSRALGREIEQESELLKPLLSGKHIQRYVALDTRQLLLFPYTVHNGTAALIPADEFEQGYPRCWAYLQENRKALEDRERGKMRHQRWYAYVYPKSLALHDVPKFAVPRLVHRLEAFHDGEGAYYLDNVDVGGLILKEGSHLQYLYVLALLNSKLLDWYFRQISVPFRGGFRSANRQYLEPLPIRVLEVGKPADKRQHDSIVGLVEEMLALQERLAPLRGMPSEERLELERRIAQVDRALDEAVYALYGLTDAERRLVEGET